MNIPERLRELAAEIEANEQRYQAWHSLITPGNLAVMDSHLPSLSPHHNVTGRVLAEKVESADPDLVRVACALLNLGYEMPLPPAIMNLLLAFRPGGDQLAADNLFDSLQTAFQSLMQRDYEYVMEGDEIALQMRGIVQRHFAYRPVTSPGERHA